MLKGEFKLPAYTKSDTWVFAIVVPLSIMISNAILLGSHYFSSWKVFLVATGIYLGEMFVIFQICGFLALWFLKKFPEIKDTPKRIALSLSCFIVLTVSAVTPLMWLYDKIPLLHYKWSGYINLWVALVSVLTNIILTILFEGLAFFERWKATLTETEQLKEENLRSQLQSLKNQINPHFLFNSINSLSSLISEDPEKAELFLDEMSKVYRYLLRNNEDNLIPLQTEIQFINSYFHLLKTRYGDGISLMVNVPPDCKDLMIPPLTLQILVENAVKHNMILKEQPLKIEIACANHHQLMVKNNLQKKELKVQSSKVGLENIAAKYQLLNQPDIMINDKGDEFIVTVPLIPKKIKSVHQR